MPNPLTNELKKYGDIKSAINGQSEKSGNFSKEIDVLDKQKQCLLAYLMSASSAINAVDSLIFCYKWLLDNYAKYVRYKINDDYSVCLPLSIHLVCLYS